MHRIFIGLVVLVVIAVCVGATLHWAAGIALIALPVLTVYIRLKLAPAYRQASSQLLESTANDKS